MRVLVVGAGGREHALAWACARSRIRPELLCAPGNGGTALCAENVEVAADDAVALARLVGERAVDLVVIGPDAAAAAGVADHCAAAGALVFGPTAAAARIESSKAFAKSVMDAAGIPTARWASGGSSDRGALMNFVRELGGACVVKADGPALGKGVMVCDSADEAAGALRRCLDERRFGPAGDGVVVEERLGGREVSVFALCDGASVRMLPPACDYKRAFDGDEGPNTGGMGAYSPPHDGEDLAVLARAEHDVIRPCLEELRRRGTPFTGCLYAGLMLCDDGVRVLEFNARFGDPEAQVILPRVAEDVLELLVAAARAELGSGPVRTGERVTAGVVCAGAGYPARSDEGRVITGVDSLDGDALCFHGGTRRAPDGTLTTAGGRVLTVVGSGAGHEAARTHAYANVARVSFEGMRFRRDIGAVMAGRPA